MALVLQVPRAVFLRWDLRIGRGAVEVGEVHLCAGGMRALRVVEQRDVDDDDEGGRDLKRSRGTFQNAVSAGNLNMFNFGIRQRQHNRFTVEILLNEMSAMEMMGL